MFQSIKIARSFYPDKFAINHRYPYWIKHKGILQTFDLYIKYWNNMSSRLKNTSMEFHANLIKSMIKRRISKSRFFLPVTTTFFITLRCNLKCSYCQPIPPHVKELPTEKTLEIIEKIRYKCPGLYISGGEPLLRNDIPVILKRARELRFKPLWLITNALNLHERLDCLKYLDYLAVSLDSLNIEKWERILGVKNVAHQIIENIKLVAGLQEKYGFILAINNLINSETISDFDEISEFCKEYNIKLTPQPVDDWTKLGDNLQQNEEYFELIRKIKRLKSQGNKQIIVTNVYLDYIMKNKMHSCYPTMNPRVYPDGSLFYPCTNIQKVYGNIFDYPNLYTMMKEAYRTEKLPDCSMKSNKCNINCLIEPAVLVDRPHVFVRDLLDNFRA